MAKDLVFFRINTFAFGMDPSPTSSAFHHARLVVVIVIAAFTQRTIRAFFLLQAALITEWFPIFFVKMSHISYRENEQKFSLIHKLANRWRTKQGYIFCEKRPKMHRKVKILTWPNLPNLFKNFWN